MALTTTSTWNWIVLSAFPRGLLFSSFKYGYLQPINVFPCTCMHVCKNVTSARFRACVVDQTWNIYIYAICCADKPMQIFDTKQFHVNDKKKKVLMPIYAHVEDYSIIPFSVPAHMKWLKQFFLYIAVPCLWSGFSDFLMHAIV